MENPKPPSAAPPAIAAIFILGVVILAAIINFAYSKLPKDFFAFLNRNQQEQPATPSYTSPPARTPATTPSVAPSATSTPTNTSNTMNTNSYLTANSYTGSNSNSMNTGNTYTTGNYNSTTRNSNSGTTSNSNRARDFKPNGRMITEQYGLFDSPSENGNNIALPREGDRIYINRSGQRGKWFPVKLRSGEEGWMHGDDIEFDKP